MKLCSGCGITKPLTGFAKNLSRKDKVQSYCRECKAGYDHNYYSKNRATHYQRVKRLLAENRTKLWDYLDSHSCVDCGEKNPIVLEFDHIKKGKVGSISYLLSRQRWSWASLLKEIDKCEVRCANCHRIKTFDQFGWNQPLVANKLGV